MKAIESLPYAAPMKVWVEPVEDPKTKMRGGLRFNFFFNFDFVNVH